MRLTKHCVSVFHYKKPYKVKTILTQHLHMLLFVYSISCSVNVHLRSKGTSLSQLIVNNWKNGMESRENLILSEGEGFYRSVRKKCTLLWTLFSDII